MATSVCLSPQTIERLAGGEQDAEALAHTEICAACREALRSAREDEGFLSRVRTLATPALGPQGAPRLAGYHVLGVISSGAQGIVYRGVQESTSRDVAIKTLAPELAASARQRQRALREAEIAARLRHPNIVTVFESRPLPDNRIAVVMEFVDGAPLDTWSPEGGDASAKREKMLRVFLQVCNAIHHAHLNGVIHRDLKPDNILVTAEGRPVVLDFGIAKAGGIHTTMTGEFAGTPAYASPEQVAGRPQNVDALTDVYSLGVILYRLVCGVMPYDLSGSLLDIARTIESTPPTPPRTVRPGVPHDLEAIILHALEKDKKARYQSAAALARDIERFLAGDPVEARSSSGWYLLRKAVAVNRRRLAVVCAGVVLVAGAAITVLYSQAEARKAADRAALDRQLAQAESIRARAVTELLRSALPSSDPARPDIDLLIGSGLTRLFFRLETGEFAEEPELDSALRRLWSQVYTGFGAGKAASYVEYADISLRNGLTRLRSQHEGDHPEIAATLHDLAGVMLVRRRPAEAEPYSREALDMRERLFGKESRPAAETRVLHAKILLAVGRTQEADAEADAALRVFRAAPDAEADIPVAALSRIKARCALQRSEPSHAEPFVKDALVRTLRRLPPDDPDVVASLLVAADLCAASAGSDLAVFFRQAFSGYDRPAHELLRTDAAALSSSDRGNASNRVLTGRTAALGRLVRVQETLLGEDHPSVVRTLLARARAAEGEHDFATKADCALRAADILTRREGYEGPAALVCIEEAASVYAYAGKAALAVPLAERALNIRMAVPEASRDHLLAANGRRMVAFFLSLADRHEQAIPVSEQAIRELSALLPPEHHIVALARAGLALSLAATGELEKADELSEAALRDIRASKGRAMDQYAHAHFIRGHILAQRGDYAAALPLLDTAWQSAYRDAFPNFHWRKILIHDAARCAAATGDEAGAAAWLRQAELPEEFTP